MNRLIESRRGRKVPQIGQTVRLYKKLTAAQLPTELEDFY